MERLGREELTNSGGGNKRGERREADSAERRLVAKYRVQAAFLERCQERITPRLFLCFQAKEREASAANALLLPLPLPLPLRRRRRRLLLTRRCFSILWLQVLRLVNASFVSQSAVDWSQNFQTARRKANSSTVCCRKQLFTIASSNLNTEADQSMVVARGHQRIHVQLTWLFYSRLI